MAGLTMLSDNARSVVLFHSEFDFRILYLQDAAFTGDPETSSG